MTKSKLVPFGSFVITQEKQPLFDKNQANATGNFVIPREIIPTLTKKQACAVWKEDHHIKTPTYVIRGCEITPYNRSKKRRCEINPYNRSKKRRHEKIKMIFSQRLNLFVPLTTALSYFSIYSRKFLSFSAFTTRSYDASSGQDMVCR